MNTLGPSVPVSPAASKGRGEGAGADSAGFADAFDGAFSALGPRTEAPSHVSRGEGTTPTRPSAPASPSASTAEAAQVDVAPQQESAPTRSSPSVEADVKDAPVPAPETSGEEASARAVYGLAQSEAQGSGAQGKGLGTNQSPVAAQATGSSASAGRPVPGHPAATERPATTERPASEALRAPAAPTATRACARTPTA